MAKAPLKQAAPVEPQPAEAKPKPRKKRGLLIALVLLVLLGAGGGAWFFLQEQDGEAGAGAKAEAPKEPEKPAVFFNLDSFTVNLQPEAGDQYLQVGLVVKVKDNATLELLKTQLPEIRNGILLLLSSKRASEISTVPGKEKLSGEILALVRKPLPPETAQQQVQAVFFAAFVIQ